MTILLECTSPTTRHRWVLRPGQTARVGKSAWNEFCVPGDPQLEQIHFSVDYRRGLLVEALNDGFIELDGQPVIRSFIAPGATLRAGTSLFQFTQPLDDCQYGPFPAALTSPAETTQQTWERKPQTLSDCGMSTIGQVCVADSHAPEAAVRQLETAGLLEDAVRLIAGILPFTSLIAWCVDMVGAKSESTETTKESIGAWIAQSTEIHRMRVSQTLDLDRAEDPWTWIVSAVTWTGGSLGPASTEPISPPAHLPRLAAITALQLCAAKTDAMTFRANCIRSGLDRIQRERTGASPKV